MCLLAYLHVFGVTETYGWFFNRDDNTYRGVRKGGPAIGFETTLNYIEECFEKYGPFDGILGYSQGGCLLGLLCSLQERGCKLINFLIQGHEKICFQFCKSTNSTLLYLFLRLNRIAYLT